MLLERVMSQLHAMDERAFIAITMKAGGYTHPSIAEALGCKPKAVDRLVTRGRRVCEEILAQMGGVA